MDEPTDEALAAAIAKVQRLLKTCSSREEARLIQRRLDDLTHRYRMKHGIGVPLDPLSQALEIDPRLRSRDHLEFLSGRIAQAVRDVENGQSRYLAVSMPPRSGKTTLVSIYSVLWMLRRHPEWSVIQVSFDPSLTTNWAKTVRRTIEHNPGLGISIEKDAGAVGSWSTTRGGGVYATSVGGSLTGRGCRVLLIDDPHKDHVDAHSPTLRERVWNWWLSVSQTRLEPPHLVVVVQTRWHKDDLIGRLTSPDHEGDPSLWEEIRLPAIADGPDDHLGREIGEPLLSPLIFEETPAMAIERLDIVKRSVGTYVWNALYQQRPAAQRGAVIDVDWLRFWTLDPSKETSDGRVVYVDPKTLIGGQWLDSWDASFGGTSSSNSFVVGQRWVKTGPTRYLVGQTRGRWAFTTTLEHMERFSSHESPYGAYVHQRLIEKAANGSAIIDVIKDHISGVKPILPKTSKEARARSVTPEFESGHVRFPHPSDPGNEWVLDLISEVRDFPYGAHDDQVDAMVQALTELREVQPGIITVPNRNARLPGSSLRTARIVR
jgi:predicted phage terminase large subunit-like protein